MRIDQVKRSKARSAVAAAAYRAGELLRDTRTGKTHDYRDKLDVEHKEILLPPNVPAWLQGITRGALWNAAEAAERRKDAQVARDLRITIPRELNKEQRITLVREFVIENYVKRGMVADLTFHCPIGGDGEIQPHAHVLLTLRPANETGFGLKSRHDMIPDPLGRNHPDGRPVMVESNPDSWNSAAYFADTRVKWQDAANAALERAGSSARIDHRSLLARNLARMPEPVLGLARHLLSLRGVMRVRFGQWQYSKLYQAVERRANAEFLIDTDPVANLKARAEHRAAVPPPPEPSPQRMKRLRDWIDRQLARLPIAQAEPQLGHAAGSPDRDQPRNKPSTSNFGMER